MNLKQLILILSASIFLPVAAKAQTVNQYDYQQMDSTSMNDNSSRYSTAHINARNLLKEEFYWSSIEESGPFGNDNGSDAYHGLKDWKKEHPTGNPKDYLQELLTSWNIPLFDLEETSLEKMETYIAAQANDTAFNSMAEQLKGAMKETGNNFDEKQFNEIFGHVQKNMGLSYFMEINEAIIAIGFGQFVIDGWINADMKQLTLNAIKRQLLPITNDQIPVEYKVVRSEQLNKMLNAVEKMNSKP